MSRRTADRLRREEGQMLVLAVLLLVVLIGFLGLVVDVGYAYVQRRFVQNAADAAALAATQELAAGSDQLTIWNRIDEYIARNTPDGARPMSFHAEYLPGGQPIMHAPGSPPAGATGLRVTASEEHATFFSGVVGFYTMTVSAQASGAIVQSPSTCLGGYAVWADGRTGVADITLSGSDGVVTGQLHSNRDLRVSGSHHTFQGVCEYVGSYHLAGSSMIFNPSANNPRRVPPAPLPVRYDIAVYRPGGKAAVAAEARKKYHYIIGDLSLSGSNQTLDGLYYVTGDVRISGSRTTGTFTIVAEGQISLSGSNHDMAAYDDGLLFFSNTSGVDVSGSSTSWKGVIYAPNGPIDMSGSSNTTYRGSLIGRAVDLSGSGLRIDYDSQYCPAASRRPVVRISE